MTRTPTPQLSHADRRAQLDALMANYTGPITSDTLVATRSPIEGTTPGRSANLARHKNIRPTVRYTERSPTRFKKFWREER
jgi:hypothetical protein